MSGSLSCGGRSWTVHASAVQRDQQQSMQGHKENAGGCLKCHAVSASQRRSAICGGSGGALLDGMVALLIKVPCGQTADGARLLGLPSLPRNKKFCGDVQAHTHSKASLQVVLQQCSAVRAEVFFLGWLLGRSPTPRNAPLSPEAPARDVRFCVLLLFWGCIDCGVWQSQGLLLLGSKGMDVECRSRAD